MPVYSRRHRIPIRKRWVGTRRPTPLFGTSALAEHRRIVAVLVERAHSVLLLAEARPLVAAAAASHATATLTEALHGEAVGSERSP